MLPPRLQRETLAAVLFFLVSTYTMTIMQIAGDGRHIRYFGESEAGITKPLPDVGHEWLPQLDNERLLDFMVNSMAFLAILRVCLTAKPQRAIRRLLWMQASIHAIRGLVLFVTTLPNPYTNDCIDSRDKSMFLLALRVSFRVSVTCSDITISGHSATTTSSILLQLLYTPMNRFQKLGSLLYLLAVWTFIIASRYHYTMDVVLGALITFSVYCIYHLALMLPPLPDKKQIGFVYSLALLLRKTDGETDTLGVCEQDVLGKKKKLFPFKNDFIIINKIERDRHVFCTVSSKTQKTAGCSW